MKRLSLIGSATVLSAFVLSLTAIYSPSTSDQTAAQGWAFPHDTPSQKTPVRRTFRLLRVAAKSLAHFPKMKQAVAASNQATSINEDIFEDETVRLTGIGPVSIGMTLQEAAAALETTIVPIGSNLTGECAYYQPQMLSQALGLMVVDGRIIRVDVWPGSSIETVSGIAIGATEADLFEQYPDQLDVSPNPYTQGKFLTFVPNNPELSLYRLVFETDAQGKVIQYRTGQFPAVTWHDGCV